MLGLDLDDNNTYPYIGRTALNNGIVGYLEKQAFEPNKAGGFSVVQIGEKVCLWQEQAWYATQNLFALNPLFECNKPLALYLITVITSNLKHQFGEVAYSSYPTKKSLSEMCFALPSTPEGSPDWQYMENYMRSIMENTEQSLNCLA